MPLPRTPRVESGHTPLGKPGTAIQFQRRELVAVPVLQRRSGPFADANVVSMRIVIVGGGCSGLLVAFQLLRKGFQHPLTIVEPRAELGPPRRGDLFETIAVPEIRVQAESLATHLLSRDSG